MAKVLLKDLGLGRKLYQDSKTGLTRVEDGRSGTGHSAHPSADPGVTKSALRQRKWSDDDKIVRAFGLKYNISQLHCKDEWDHLARQHCRCGGQH